MQAKGQVRKERIMWWKSIEGRATMLECQLAHKTRVFNKLVQKWGTQHGGGRPCYLIKEI